MPILLWGSQYHLHRQERKAAVGTHPTQRSGSQAVLLSLRSEPHWVTPDVPSGRRAQSKKAAGGAEPF